MSDKVINVIADNEDLVQKCNILKFKDRDYNPDKFSGLGYKILRKNWVDCKNILTQETVGVNPTVFEVRYDFDLDGCTITLPKGSTLLFNGGSLNNGTIICDGTNIEGINNFDAAGTAVFEGTFSNGLCMYIDNKLSYWDIDKWVVISKDEGFSAQAEAIESNTAEATVLYKDGNFDFKFKLPKGEKGEQGIQGPKGDKGERGNDGTIAGFSASAVAEDSATAYANVQVVDTSLRFSFGLPKGAKGETGPRGPKGDKGEPGDKSIATRTVFIFKSSETRPETPEGGHWNVSDNTVIIPDGWAMSDNFEGNIWQSSNTFSAIDGEVMGPWTLPIKITGDSGKSIYVLDLSNEVSTVTCDYNGKVLGILQDTVATVYYGSSIDEGWNFSASFKGCSGTISKNGRVTLTSLSDDTGTVTITATKEGCPTLTAVYTISKIRAGKDGEDGEPAVSYWIIPDTNYVSISKEGIITPKQITCTRYKQVGDNAPIITTEKTLKYQTSIGNETVYTGPVVITSYMQWVDFILYDGNTVLDKERVVVVRDGRDGIDGVDGEPGADGKSAEFIYSRTKNDLITPSRPTNSQKEDYVPEGWTDNPQGISEEYRCEWVCTREFKNGSWQNWEGPALWAKWGANGQDGDGVEYIYKLENSGIAPNNPTPTNINTDQYQGKGTYEGKEYIPSGWTDNPTGVSQSNKFEWVCVRKRKNGVWGKFQEQEDGSAGSPALWAKYGDKGDTGPQGLSIRTMYVKTSNSTTKPTFVANNINPGSSWGTTIPSYSGTEAIWAIQAYVTYDNKLSGTWQGPYIITGVNGKDGVAPNYKTYVYYKSSSKPSKPTFTTPQPPSNSSWKDYPDTSGNWYQCVGTVNGQTNTVVEWSEVLPVNGRDGTAQDGKFTEFRFANGTTAPSLQSNIRTPSGWSLTASTPPEKQFVWMTQALINPDDTLNGQWSAPVRISGEQGPTGNTGPAGNPGPQGATGIPGVSIELRYCLGTTTTYDGSSSPSGNNPTGWSNSVPATTTAKPYIWCIQGKKSYSSSTDTTGTVTWSTPFRLSGINGTDGSSGSKSQIIYPAGIYSNTTTYTTDDYKAPYVLDTSDGNYYVLNAKMSWLGTAQNNRTPSQDYAANGGKYWLKFDAFEAVYTKIGIIANGLIGSAVFNGDYMFSQHGILNHKAYTVEYYCTSYSSPSLPSSYPPSGTWNKVSSSTSSGVYNICAAIKDKATGEFKSFSTNYVTGIVSSGNVSISPTSQLNYNTNVSNYEDFNPNDPYGDSAKFYPNFCVNFKTGEMWVNGGKSHFLPDGSGVLGGNIQWDTDGTMQVNAVQDVNKMRVLSKIPTGYQKEFTIPIVHDSRMALTMVFTVEAGCTLDVIRPKSNSSGYERVLSSVTGTQNISIDMGLSIIHLIGIGSASGTTQWTMIMQMVDNSFSS